ncbi:cupin domain-containing protein [Methanoculleus sp. FWC-SCC1]|uniref:Cupin domain-containing protein n=1 Tax=Methanoculleus frigidifontis TaxID=2584085 RepID=A0ABT8M8K8_9EURY|nr:cupin domain-containing protein [Methanoculleus sp. FWC-SCC1]MDN7024267.1 cupin domain-containing protein [Methanoculleus sp. FWC-SCC1]
MHRIVLLLFACMLFAAGCLTAAPSQAEEQIRPVAPADAIPIFGGQATYSELIGDATPDICANYSMGLVTIPPGNATLPHRLIGTTELVYVLSGTAEISCDNETVTVRKGEVVLLPESVLQSIAAAGDTDLAYLTVIEPPFTDAIEVSGDGLAAIDTVTNGTPVVVAGPDDGIPWDAGTGGTVYTLANPVLMPKRGIAINYSVAYGELLPGGYVAYDRLNGSSDFIYVISGEVAIATPDGERLRVPAGSGAFVPPGVMKETRNIAESATMLVSFVDPVWTEEKTALWE